MQSKRRSRELIRNHQCPRGRARTGSTARAAVLMATGCLATLGAALAPPCAGAFDGARAHAVVEEISSDAFLGRKSGLEGGRLIEEHVAQRFARWGLEPAGEDGSFFHGFPMLVTEERGAKMELLDSPYGPVAFLYGNDFSLITNSGSGQVTGEVVFVGHGLCDPQREWDDYGDTDLTGKIALITRGTPDNGYDWDREGSRDSTLTEAAQRGAVGILFSQGPRPVHGGAIHDAVYRPDLPMAYVSHRIVNLLLMGTGYDADSYGKALRDEPTPLATGKRLRLHTEVPRVADGRARNVVGLVPGSDPALHKELVLVGGHMDHLGTDARDLVYNGADDNASGTAVVMELARSFARMTPRPRRSIVFMTFAGEEQGLLGSKALADRPPIDLDGAVLMVNFDMVGQGDGRVGIGGGEYYPEIWEAFVAGLPEEDDPAQGAETTVASGSVESGKTGDETGGGSPTLTIDMLQKGRAWGGDSSDHAPFRNAGIPVCNIWSEGDHDFYHSIQDDIDWIDEEVLDAVGRMAERWMLTVANHPAPLRVAHRAGRALLYAASQVDFDGRLEDPLPPCVRGRVQWLDAGTFPHEPFVAAVGALQASAASGDSISMAEELHDLHSATYSGRRAIMVGLTERAGHRVAERDMPWLGDLHVSLARWAGGAPAEADSGYVKELASKGVALLLPAARVASRRLPDGARAYLRFHPARGERIEDAEAYARDKVLFVATLESGMSPVRLARDLARLGYDRVHLDLVPWLATGGEEQIWEFLERLQEAGSFEPRHMTAMLGGNLDRI